MERNKAIHIVCVQARFLIARKREGLQRHAIAIASPSFHLVSNKHFGSNPVLPFCYRLFHVDMVRCSGSLAACVPFHSKSPDLEFSTSIQSTSRVASVVELHSNAAEKFLRRLEFTRMVRDVLKGTAAWGPGTAKALERLNVDYDTTLVAQVLSSDIAPRIAFCFFNWLKEQKGFNHGGVTYNRMISSLKEAGLVEEIHALIEEFCQNKLAKTARNLSRLIWWYGKVHNLEGALCIWHQMKEVRVKAKVQDYAVMIDLLAENKRFHEGAALYLEMVQVGHIPSSQTYKVLISHLVENGNLDAAYMIFSKLGQVQVKPTMLIYGILMSAYAKAGNKAMVKELGKEMRKIDNRASKSLLALLRRLQTTGKIKEAQLLAAEVWPELSVEERSTRVLELGTISEIHEGSHGDEGLSEHEDGKAGYDPCIDPTSLAELLLKNNPDTFSALEHANIQWTPQLAFEILRRCRNSEVALKIFFWLQRQPGFKHDRFTFSKILDLLAVDRQIEALQSLLDQALQKGLKLTSNTMGEVLKAFGAAGKSNEALNIFRKMNKFGVQPNASLYAHLIHSFAWEKRCVKAKEILDEMQQAGFQPTVHTFALLIQCFGRVEMAEIMFQQISKAGLELNAEAYKALANVYFSNGKPDAALKVFEDSQTAGIKPTFALILAVVRGLRKFARHKELNDFRAKFVQVNATRKKNWHLVEDLMMIHDHLMRNVVEKPNAHDADCG